MRLDGGEGLAVRATNLWPAPVTVEEEPTRAPGDAAALEEAKQRLATGGELLDRGDATGALEQCEQCLACAERIRDAEERKAMLAPALGSLGNAHYSLGQYQLAIARFEQVAPTHTPSVPTYRDLIIARVSHITRAPHAGDRDIARDRRQV